MEEAGHNMDSNDDIDDRILPDQLIFNEGTVAERKTLLAPLHIRMAMQSALRTSRKPPETAVIVMNSMCKVFVADLVRRSVIVQQDWGQTGPLRPVHIREAIRRSRRQSHDPGSSPAASQRRELFRR
ncbi:unnamed protein product (mitochondrion) [Plasmodiophora brassicae]|uniref:TAFII28-like protein domain-containing protein n=1 Tax=Plasmodiophora brassicae TaxID=37360 RepID=A0A3P3XZW6_PLABS|nr:unnamed protein product [Plasmodiophora brassicae]